MFTKKLYAWCHGLVWLSAGLWLGLEAWLTLDATFHLPTLQIMARMLPWSTSLVAGLVWMQQTSWPVVSLLVLLFLREEAHRWFSGHSTNRTADRLTTAWFVFVGTLSLVDWLSADISVAWPVSALDATVWLFLTRAVSLLSRHLHGSGRRSFNKFLRHWPIIHWLSSTSLLSTPCLRMLKGVIPHVPSPHATSQIHHRAR